jgi:hypothetical protein
MTDMPHREASTDRLLRQHLPPSPEPPATDACLDADTASAWIAGRLSGPALDEAREHVAECARCQALMATLTRLETEPAETRPDDAPARWWRWLVPVGVVAAMIAVVLFLPRETPRPASPIVQERGAARQDQNKDLEFRPAPSIADAKKNARDETPPTAASPAAAQPAAATLATKNAELQPRQAAPPPPSGSGALDETQAAAGAKTKAAGANADAPASRNLGALQHAASSANELADGFRVDIVSPDGTTRWRISSRTVEKSTDRGATWTTAVTITDGRWTAGAAPSATTLWVVGRQGLVERTTDGRTFARVAFPETTDLSAVQATGAETATITTADGRSFGTTDGGKSWVQRLLQETPAGSFKD